MSYSWHIDSLFVAKWISDLRVILYTKPGLLFELFKRTDPMICRKTPLFLAVSAAVFTLSTYADQSAMEEVVVTADFRQTDVQSIPEATTVVGAAAIEQRSADHLE
ncbi:hypothetical protein Q4595_19225, partial [Wenyingzhuangia sp. 1_MG-2023]|nr:hypothetical protein [Wenyingzhuangia sp. 1_MG-2023]